MDLCDQATGPAPSGRSRTERHVLPPSVERAMPPPVAKHSWNKEAKDILSRSAPAEPPKLTSRKIGIHTSTAGGVETAAERAYRLGCNAFQVFSSFDTLRQIADNFTSYFVCQAVFGRR